MIQTRVLTGLNFRIYSLIHLICSILLLIGCESSSSQPETLTLESNDQGKKERILKQITLSGSGYDLGFQHGSQLKSEIAEIVAKWKENTTTVLGRDADEVLEEFLQYAQFDGAIKEWTPELYEEMKGIADGSEQPFNYIYVLNLLDEFWVYVDDPENHHCSDLGVPAHKGKPTIVAQNMDLESYTDGFQTIVRKTKTEKEPEQLILIHPGLIALNGLNENGVGLVVNTIMQLKASNSGLPVAFIGRKILSMTDKNEIIDFITQVPHASGQSYIIGIGNEVFNYEGSAGEVAAHDPKNENGTVYHTNHPIVNGNLKGWHAQFDPAADPEALPVNSNSYIRLSAVSSRMANRQDISIDDIMSTLRSKDDPANPVCRTWNSNQGFTFASTIMSLGSEPVLYVTAGPPDESEYKTIPIKK